MLRSFRTSVSGRNDPKVGALREQCFGLRRAKSTSTASIIVVHHAASRAMFSYPNRSLSFHVLGSCIVGVKRIRRSRLQWHHVPFIGYQYPVCLSIIFWRRCRDSRLKFLVSLCPVLWPAQAVRRPGHRSAAGCREGSIAPEPRAARLAARMELVRVGIVLRQQVAAGWGCRLEGLASERRCRVEAYCRTHARRRDRGCADLFSCRQPEPDKQGHRSNRSPAVPAR